MINKKHMTMVALALILLAGCDQFNKKTEYTPTTSYANVTNAVNVSQNLTNESKQPDLSYLQPIYGQLTIYSFYMPTTTTHIVILPSNETILIDARYRDINQLISYFKDLGFVKPTYLIYTSEIFASDAEPYVIKFHPKKSIHNGLVFTNKSARYTSLQAVSYDTELELYPSQEFKLEVFVPYDDGQGFLQEGMNNLAFRFTYGINSLYLGTCSGGCEDRIQDTILYSDVMYLSQSCDASLFILKNINPSLVVAPPNLCKKVKDAISQTYAKEVSGDSIQISSDGKDFKIVKYTLAR